MPRAAEAGLPGTAGYAAEEAEARRLVGACVERVGALRRLQREAEEAKRVLKAGARAGAGAGAGAGGWRGALVAVPGTAGAVLRRGVEVEWPLGRGGEEGGQGDGAGGAGGRGSVGVRVGDRYVVARSVRQAQAWLGGRVEALAAAEERAVEELEGLNMRYLLSQYLARQVGEEGVAGEIRTDWGDDVAFWEQVRGGGGAGDDAAWGGEGTGGDGEGEEDGFGDVLARMEALAAEEEEAGRVEEQADKERQAWERYDPVQDKGASPFKAGFLGGKKAKRSPAKAAAPAEASQPETARMPLPLQNSAEEEGGEEEEEEERPASPAKGGAGEVASAPGIEPGAAAAAVAEEVPSPSIPRLAQPGRQGSAKSKPREMKRGFFGPKGAAKASVASSGAQTVPRPPPTPRKSVHGEAFPGIVVERNLEEDEDEEDNDGEAAFFAGEGGDDYEGDGFGSSEDERYHVQEDVEPPMEWTGSVPDDATKQGFRSVILTDDEGVRPPASTSRGLPLQEGGAGPSGSGGEGMESMANTWPTAIMGPQGTAAGVGNAEEAPSYKRISRFKMERIARATMGDNEYEAVGLNAPYNGRYNVPRGPPGM